MVRRVGPPDRGDNKVEEVDRAQEANEDVLAVARLLQLEFAAASNDHAPVVDPEFEGALEADPPWLAVDDSHHVDGEGRTHGRELVEEILDLSGLALALEFDDNAHATAVRFVAKVGDAFDLLVADEVGDLLDEGRLVDLVGELGDDDHSAPGTSGLFDDRPGVHDDAAMTLAVGMTKLFAFLAYEGDAGGREIGALDVLEEVIERGFR